MESLPPYWELYRKMLYEMVGHPEKDKELLASASPVLHIDKIKAPLFIAQGANDPRVVKAETDQMVEALKNAGVEVPYMVKEDEGHGFSKKKNQITSNETILNFLDKYLLKN